MISNYVREEMVALETTALAIMLYGSYARGDQSTESDIDVLEIVRKPTPARKLGNIVVTCYTSGQLTNLAKQGSLFVLHLRTEGVILHDPENIIRSALDSYIPPINYEKLLTTISASAAVLHLRLESLDAQQVAGIINVSMYLLRTLVYVQCLSQGTPAFSIAKARAILGNHRAIELLEKRRHLSKNPNMFDSGEMLKLIEEFLGRKVEPLGSELGAVSVNATLKNKEAGKLVTRILLGDSTINYELLAEDL